MRKLLNTLYVTRPEAYLKKDGMNLVVTVKSASKRAQTNSLDLPSKSGFDEVKDEEVFRIPIVNIESVVTFGYMGASPGVMKLCADNHVSLSFLTPNGRFIARVQGPTQGNVLLRRSPRGSVD